MNPARSRVRTVLTAPFAARTRREFAYSWLTMLPAIPAFVVALVWLVGGVLGLVAVGLPLLSLCLLAARRLLPVFARPARALLDWQWPEPTPRSRRALRDREAWGALAYCAVKFPLTLVTVYIGTVASVLGLAALTSPVWWPLTRGKSGPWDGLSWPETLLLAGQGAAALLVFPWLLRLLVGLEKAVVEALVVPRDDAQRIAFLEASRRAVSDDAAATLRQIERDLHDGTQARLVMLGIVLSRLEAHVDDPRARDLVESAGHAVADTLAELREIIRGVHPPALDDGLGTAVATLVSRSAIPTELIDDLPARTTGPAAATLYFAAAELLTNVTRHARATHATVRLGQTPTALRLEVIDDGCGGATADGAGTGLAGLRRRAETLDGRMSIASPPGGPTVITVEVDNQ